MHSPFKHWPWLVLSLATPGLAQAQLLQRQLGDFDLTLGTTPSRTMAQGLVSPSTGTAVHGGMDLAHDSGFYVGQWAPSLGLTDGSTLELDSYAGYKRSLSPSLGYEVGMMNYARPQLDNASSHQLFAGLRVLGTRIGAALSAASETRASTLYADFGALPLWGIGLSMKVSHYQLATPYSLDGGGQVTAYSDWSMQLSRPWRGTDLNVSWSNSDLNGLGCAAYAGHNPECGGTLTFRAARSFF
ncbi:TorF family putative porin [Pseudomonas sp. KNUC1026]|uniref:TorF family putative porin n=1 Tax=Pseudomonas sp. KNUC1026 TaxID=2893890 RepID=UPI001F273692|nr:TorF family putative porin [Pseudomonas sp. KNUC1026]UFH48047.1 TorF family putative porin [Pseudomonas sp. KNUC1026]